MCYSVQHAGAEFDRSPDISPDTGEARETGLPRCGASEETILKGNLHGMLEPSAKCL